MTSIRYKGQSGGRNLVLRNVVTCVCDVHEKLFVGWKRYEHRASAMSSHRAIVANPICAVGYDVTTVVTGSLGLRCHQQGRRPTPFAVREQRRSSMLPSYVHWWR